MVHGEKYKAPTDKRFYSPMQTALDWLLPFDGIVTFAKDHLPFLVSQQERAERVARSARKVAKPVMKQQIKK